MNYRLYHTLLPALGLLLLCACGNGSSNQQTLEPVQQTTDQLQENLEANFLLDSYSYGLMLVHYSELAAQKASTPTVKSFAESSLAYHQKLNEEVEHLAAARKLALPQTPGEDVQAYRQELAELPAEAFEIRYLEVLRDIQTKMIGRYEQATSGSLEEYLHNWSMNTLPNLRAHAQTVTDLLEQLQ
ncbi:DUF4142 domain-containing protein [Cesiribacter andamanensis]|uniref:Putative outer membrane protein n=1 Tax=Cesiribacter andamanensis AMV16 TaxID=1279009 RepID=M7MX32_9BACT|nr:DUF4142 domain-containing protein [Cesiribacter andamanensis]EMR00988.1 putative outer membrane protein [Cesiribacter andamanensis AMV16]